MSAWWSLLRVQLKIGLAFTPTAVAGGNRARLGLREWALFALIIVAMLPLAAVAGGAAFGMYTALAAFGQPEAMLTTFVVAAVLLSLVFGLFYVISAFYYARDLGHLVPLPLTPAQVIGSKFGVVLANEWVTMLPILAPPLLVYGFLAHPGALYWPKALLVFLTVPVLPLAAGSLFALGLMRLIGSSRQRDWLMVFGTLLAMVIALGTQFVMQAAGPGMSPARVAQLTTDLVGQAGRLFPPAIWATRALQPGQPAGGLGALVLVLLVNAAGVAVLWLASQRLFYRGLLASLEAPVRRHKLTRSALAARLERSRPALGALVWREWAVLWRTPLFVMNTLLPMVIVPAIAIGSNLTIGRIPDKDLEPLYRFLDTADLGAMGPLLGVAASAVMCLFGLLGATALTREGRQFWISRLIPVTPQVQVIAKLTFSAGVALAGSLLIGVPIGIVTRFSVWGWLYWLTGSILACVGLSAVQLCLDLWRPKLNWTDPQVAIKQNFNVVIAMVAAAALVVGGGFAVRLVSPWGWGAAQGALLAYMLLVAAGATAAALALANWTYNRIEL